MAVSRLSITGDFNGHRSLASRSERARGSQQRERETNGWAPSVAKAIGAYSGLPNLVRAGEAVSRAPFLSTTLHLLFP